MSALDELHVLSILRNGKLAGYFAHPSRGALERKQNELEVVSGEPASFPSQGMPKPDDDIGLVALEVHPAAEDLARLERITFEIDLFRSVRATLAKHPSAREAAREAFAAYMGRNGPTVRDAIAQAAEAAFAAAVREHDVHFEKLVTMLEGYGYDYDDPPGRPTAWEVVTKHVERGLREGREDTHAIERVLDLLEAYTGEDVEADQLFDVLGHLLERAAASGAKPTGGVDPDVDLLDASVAERHKAEQRARDKAAELCPHDNPRHLDAAGCPSCSAGWLEPRG